MRFSICHALGTRKKNTFHFPILTKDFRSTIQAAPAGIKR